MWRRKGHLAGVYFSSLLLKSLAEQLAQLEDKTGTGSVGSVS